MKRFEVGKTYKVNGFGFIKVTKRTKHYLTFSGDYKGRKKIADENLFDLGEHVLVDYPDTSLKLKLFCFAGHCMN